MISLLGIVSDLIPIDRCRDFIKFIILRYFAIYNYILYSNLFHFGQLLYLVFLATVIISLFTLFSGLFETFLFCYSSFMRNILEEGIKSSTRFLQYIVIACCLSPWWEIKILRSFPLKINTLRILIKYINQNAWIVINQS